MQVADHVLEINPRATYAEAFQDIGDAIKSWRAWVLLAWFEIKHSYRGSILGPLWITITMGVFVFSVGLLYSQVFGADPTSYIPWLAAGLLVWNMMAALITEGSNIYIGSSGFSTEMRLPYMLFSFKLAARHLITFAHNVIVVIVVALIFGLPVGFQTLAFVPGLAIILFCGICASVVLGLLSVRFRDVPQIIQALVQISFFLTPIIWNPAQLEGRFFLVLYNPFYHFIELMRAPLLGELPTVMNYVVTISLSFVLAIFAVMIFKRYRNRIAYWI
ncbi:MAG: ABC transporter permease [Inquilinaceae bacterium]